MWLGLGSISGRKAEMRIHHIRVGLVFKRLSWGIFFPRELKEATVLEFLTLKQNFLSMHEYVLKFIYLSCYDPDMVKDTRSRMSLFVAGFGRALNKEGRAAMMIRDLYISRLMAYVQQVEVENLRDRD